MKLLNLEDIPSQSNSHNEQISKRVWLANHEFGNVTQLAQSVFPSGEKVMKINGEAVYGSKRSPFTTVPDWGFITRMGQKLYLWVFDWPASGETLALPFDNPVTKAWLLDGGSSVKVIKNKGNATTLRLPEFAPDSVVSIIAMEVTGNLP
jgi:hypothetical protein